LGGVTVRLRNKANVSEAFLDDIFSNSGLDDRELLLMLMDMNGDGYGANGLRASATSSCVFDPSLFSSAVNANTNVTIIKVPVPCCRDMERIDLVEFNEWDAVVYVPKITTDKWKDYKPYFAFVLGHELEHVKVIRERLEFHMCATWLYKHNYDIFEKSGIDCKSKKKWDFPLERHCNKKGKKLATGLFGKEEFDKCLAAMRKDNNETQKHKEYLAFIIDELEGEPYTDNICESICCDIRDYYNNRLRKAAHKIWREEKSKGNNFAEQFDINEFLPLDLSVTD